MTELLEKYFAKYTYYRDHDEMEAERYRERAIRLMQQNVQGEKLDPEVILEKIPDDWEM